MLDKGAQDDWSRFGKGPPKIGHTFGCSTFQGEAALGGWLEGGADTISEISCMPYANDRLDGQEKEVREGSAGQVRSGAEIETTSRCERGRGGGSKLGGALQRDGLSGRGGFRGES